MSGPVLYFTLLLYSLPGLAVGLVVHELGHVAGARLAGDRWSAGRLSADPRRAVDPIAVCAFVLAGICWSPVLKLSAFAVPSRFRRALTAGCGPLADLLLVVVLSALLRGPLGADPSSVVAHILGQAWLVNLLLLTILNLLPMPGLDGFTLIRSLFRRSVPRWMTWMETNSGTFYGTLLIILIVVPVLTQGTFNPIGWLLQTVVAPIHSLAVGRPPAYLGLPNIQLLFT